MGFHRASVERFAALGAQERLAVDGVAMGYRAPGADTWAHFEAVASGLRDGHRAEEGGYVVESRGTVRVVLEGLTFTPEVGGVVRVMDTGRDYRVEEVVNHPTAPEVVLEVEGLYEDM